MPELRTRSAPLGDVAWLVGTFLVLGVVAGLLWWQVATPPFYVRNAQGAVMDQAELGKRIQSDGWFLTIGFAVSLVAGLVFTRWRGRDPLLVLLVGAAASLAAGYLALRLGMALGHHDVPALVRNVTVGGHVTDSLGVISQMVLAAWPVGYLIGAVGVLLGTRSRLAESNPTSDEPVDASR